MAQIHRGTSLLELEAAHYFELDPSQMNLCSGQSNGLSACAGAEDSQARTGPGACLRLCRHHSDRHHHHKRHHRRHKHKATTRPAGPNTAPARRQHQQEPTRGATMNPEGRAKMFYTNQMRGPTQDVQREAGLRPASRRPLADGANTPAPELNSTRPAQATARPFEPIAPRDNRSPPAKANAKRSSCDEFNVSPVGLNGSSTASTSSLPSISSSPSVSPSIVCPHLSLDDLLDFRQGPRGASPHTIGLCPRCRLDPPPNVHSPLSPMFRPFVHGQQGASSKLNQSAGDLNQPAGWGRREEESRPQMRRGYSDHQACLRSGRGSPPRGPANVGRRPETRVDSLDYSLEPGELRRLQMSPALRNSVEFIRNNSIESGRVVRIYKNGEPFEKPLRVCITRGEFANIDHFLDHINTRLLVPLGARYLFHLDGQLVYSVQELKHASAYVVSGSRCFDYRASNQLKEQQQKEQQQRADRCAHDHPLRLATATAPATADAEEKNTAVSTSKTSDRSQSFSNNTNTRPARPLAAGQAPTRPAARRPAAALERKSRTEEASRVGATEPKSCDQWRDRRQPGVGSSGVARAKSELSALPGKRKKNVTFLDTGRGSSPDISSSRAPMDDNNGVGANQRLEAGRETSEDERHGPTRLAGRQLKQPPTTSKTNRATGEVAVQATLLPKEFSTSDVGIQVSDSIEGFLIDLPVALPARGDDSNLNGSSGARPARQQPGPAGKPARAAQGANKGRRQIVTIAERQLSLEEMNELKDLSHGNHHRAEEAELSQRNQTNAIHAGPNEAEEGAEPEPEPEETGVANLADSIALGADPAPSGASSKLDGSQRLVTSIQSGPADRKGKRDSVPHEHWQYPGGRAASATPTERPISQSGPSETVRARVTTPTPSLSTACGGEENSLAMSYEIGPLGADAPPPPPPPVFVRPRKPPKRAPPKRRHEVTGQLVSGLHAPEQNFRLLWANGFSINDLYPENSVSEQRLRQPEAKHAPATASGAGGAPSHLSPERPGRATGGATKADEMGAPQFKPSARYSNWICHSRRHNELIYPAGSLVVLWCQWSDEQRFYSKHKSNVSAVALATLDLDLAASAQVCEPQERPQIGASVHLWSIGELSTLMIIDDDQLRPKLIFSLRLKSSKTNGCELSVGARDDKQLLLFTFKRTLAAANSGALAEAEVKVEAAQAQAPSSQPDGERAKRRRATSEPAPSGAILRASKVLQSGQIPLLIMKVPDATVTSEPKTASPRHKQAEPAKCEPLICFGRRCFQVWSPDARQQKLRLMQADGKRAAFSGLVARANCLCRLSPSELLVGDSEGNVVLLASDLCAAAGAAPNSGQTQEPRDLKYGLESVALLGPLASGPGTRPSAGITCLTRVTGSLFISAESSCAIRFWKIQQQEPAASAAAPAVKLAADLSFRGAGKLQCEQLASISLPADLGFICAILLANYSRADSLVEFYLVATCNTILFGSVKLQQLAGREATRADLLANSSLSVVYEGHETSASGLVADSCAGEPASERPYFTCSLDCRICKWTGRRLVWKSLLPSPCVSLAVHPQGAVLAVGSNDGIVYILDKLTGLLVAYFPLTPVRVNCLAYSSDGALLAAGCANGSIFILPVYERGLKYKKVSIFQSPNAVVSLQFSVDNRYMLTSVTHAAFQELILWDLPNFRYMRDRVTQVADQIQWFESICSGSEDVRAIWENANLAGSEPLAGPSTSRATAKRLPPRRAEPRRDGFVVNLSCHRLICAPQRPGEAEPKRGNYVIASDTRGFLRLFRYPAYDIQQGFYAARISSAAVNCCRFLSAQTDGHAGERPGLFVSASLDGSICLWTLE